MSQASIAAASDQSTRFAAAHSVLQDAIASRAFPGCAYGVYAQGAVVDEASFGRFTYDESSPAVTPQTVFDVASVTKVASTTAAAMLLHQRGLLDLDTPLGELLPGFVIGREHGAVARHVRIRHLLAHSSGLPGYVDFFRSHSTPLGLLRACLELPIEAEPGTRAEYSDPGFTLLGKALEVITREPLAFWVHREIFNPLGMASTGFVPHASRRPSIPPTEEDATFRHRVIQGEVQDENASVLGGCAGHAGLFSNVADLLRFSAEILAAVQSGSPILYSPETINLFAERQPPEGSSRALGWDTPSPDSTTGHHFSLRTIGHIGFSGCTVWIDLDASIAVALLTNRTWPDRQNRAIRQVWPVFHDAVRSAF